MNNNIKHAILELFKLQNEASENQRKHGHSDRGARSGVTSGKHLDPLAKEICNELMNCGLSEKDVFFGNKNMELPGWFRPTKQWDILAFYEKKLIVAVELKSISSSFGNNANNRTEEAVGSAVDANSAVKYNLYGNGYPPIFCYVLIVKSDADSRRVVHRPNEPHYKSDKTFYDISYIDRLGIMCQRLLAERLYDAVWFVAVDPTDQTISEPQPSLTYEKFITRIKSQVDLVKA